MTTECQLAWIARLIHSMFTFVLELWSQCSLVYLSYEVSVYRYTWVVKPVFTGVLEYLSNGDNFHRCTWVMKSMFTGVLESCMATLQEGQLLLERIRRMALCADVQNRHATTSACYAIEQLLQVLQDKKRRIDELWVRRKVQLEQCIQMFLLQQEGDKVSVF